MSSWRSHELYTLHKNWWHPLGRESSIQRVSERPSPVLCQQLGIDFVGSSVEGCLCVCFAEQDLFNRIAELRVDDGVVWAIVISVAIRCCIYLYMHPRVLREVLIPDKAFFR